MARRVSRLGHSRLGYARLGSYEPTVVISVNGIDRTSYARIDGWTVRDVLGGVPNTATGRVIGFRPAVGQELLIGLGSTDVAQRLFGGYILNVTEVMADSVDRAFEYDINAISYEWLLTTRLFSGRFTATSASDVILAILETTGVAITTTGLDLALPTLDEITFTNEDVATCFDRIKARIGGQWFLDVDGDLTFVLDLSGTAWSITDADTHGVVAASGFRTMSDLSSARNRVHVEGGGVNAIADVAVGAALLPVEDDAWYSASGGSVVSGPQRIDYTGLIAGGSGSLVGTALTPTNPPTAALATGTGVTSGVHSYKYTFVTGAGETTPSGASADVTTGGSIADPSSAPSATKAFGGSLSAGVYSWKVTYYDSAGNETAPSSASGSVTMDDVSPPTVVPTTNYHYDAAAALDLHAIYEYVYTFRNSSGYETTATGRAYKDTDTVGVNTIKITRSGLSSPPAGFDRCFYRTEGFTGVFPPSTNPLKRMPGASDGFASDDSSYYYDIASDASLGATVPTSSTAIYRSATVTIPVSSDPLTVGRKLYRTVAGGSTYKLVATIANNTATSYTDTVADASLGATAPGSNTTVAGAVGLTGIAAGPTGVTSRKVYRTAAGGATYKLLATIADNTTTTYADTTADGSLGATAPSSDTSGLVQETGSVTLGSTSLLVTSPAPFESGGGWAQIGALAIRYTGKSASALTGIPASGSGSLSTTVRYGSEVIAAAMLTGIAASGDGSVQYALKQGDPVNILVTTDDTDAQTTMAAAVGDDGIREAYIQDRRLSETEAALRAQATLDDVADPVVTVRYQTRDQTTRTGRNVTITLSGGDIGSVGTAINGTFAIQSVTTVLDSAAAAFPVRTVEASSRRTSFEALLRILRRVA